MVCWVKVEGASAESSVILSAAKDLMPVANSDEVLCFAQDDSLAG
jgi:hypothetical protein